MAELPNETIDKIFNAGCKKCRADVDVENEISYDVGYEKGREDAIDECIKIAEETVWRAADMLIGYFKELKAHSK